MTALAERVRNWELVQYVNDLERQRLAELHQPPPKNDPQLFELVEVVVRRPFCVRGRRVEGGECIKIERHLARDLARIGKCEVLP